MFIIELTYTAPLAQLDEQMKAHNDFLDAHFESGYFIASGPKVPRTGGVILATADSLERVQQILEQDPFKILNLADYKITEFIASKRSEQAYQLMA
jgi:uncharacterized protein YciI